MLRSSKQAQNVIEAYRRGFRVSEDGTLVAPNGSIRNGHIHRKKGEYSVRRYTFAKQRAFDLHQLAAYQKFGEAALHVGVEVRHLNNDSHANESKNIGIGDRHDQTMDRTPENRVARATHAASFRRKMSDGDVQEARRLHAEGMSGNALAKKFNVRKSTMSYIINGRTYRGVK